MKEVWPQYSIMKEGMKEKRTQTFEYEPDTVTQIAHRLKFSLMMQLHGNHSLNNQDGLLCILGAQQALAK